MNKEPKQYLHFPSVLNVSQIEIWLSEYENYFKFLINESNCGKWSKWLKDKSVHIFPCVCPIREQDCIFIETYYELNKILELHHIRNHYKEVVSEYMEIGDDEIKIQQWIKKHETLWNKTFFHGAVEIQLRSEPNPIIRLKLNEEEFEEVITFLDIYFRHQSLI